MCTRSITVKVEIAEPVNYWASYINFAFHTHLQLVSNKIGGRGGGGTFANLIWLAGYIWLIECVFVCIVYYIVKYFLVAGSWKRFCKIMFTCWYVLVLFLYWGSYSYCSYFEIVLKICLVSSSYYCTICCSYWTSYVKLCMSS